MKKYLSLDVGGTNIKCGILNDSGEILSKEKFPTEYGEENIAAHHSSLSKEHRSKIEEDFEKEFNEEEKLVEENYNPNWTLRKCSAKILDRLSNFWAKHNSWVTKQNITR